MAVYRHQAVCVGMWRGKIKRWNTTFHSTVQGARPTIKAALMAVGYPNPGDVTGDCSGGVASITTYNVGGGAPIGQDVYFQWDVPSTWIPYTGSVWTNVPEGTPLDASGESALVVVGHMAGLSSSGKPVTTRKYLHAIPSRTAEDYADPDIDSATQALIEAAFTTTLMKDPAGISPTSVEALAYYGNHQRVRGRRRSVRQDTANAFAGGVALGAGAAGSGTGARFLVR